MSGCEYWPTNASNGQVGIQTNPDFTATTNTVMRGSYIICRKNIPGEFVLQLDAALDDGNPATGYMRAIRTASAGSAPESTALVPADLADRFIF